MTNSINPAFASFQWNNLANGNSFIDTLKKAHPKLNNDLGPLKNESGSYDQLGWSGLANVAKAGPNALAVQLADTDNSHFFDANQYPTYNLLVFGGRKNDDISTGDKDDILVGGGGHNRLWGGGGVDKFAVGLGNDEILDFSLTDSDEILVRGTPAPKLTWETMVRQEEGNSGSGAAGFSLNAKIDGSRNSFRVWVSDEEISTALNIDVEAVKNLTNSQISDVQNKIINKVSFETSRGGIDKKGNQDLWGHGSETGITESKLTGAAGNDILHSVWGNTTMTGGKGRDHFHVDLSSSNTITDLNHTEGDKIIIGEDFDNFDIADLTVTKTGNAEYELRMNGAVIAETKLKWTDSDGQVKDWNLSEEKALGLFRDKIVRQGTDDGIS